MDKIKKELDIFEAYIKVSFDIGYVLSLWLLEALLHI